MQANCIKAGMDARTPPSRYKYWLTVHAGRVLLDTIPAKTAQKESHQARYQSTNSSNRGHSAHDCNASWQWYSQQCRLQQTVLSAIKTGRKRTQPSQQRAAKLQPRISGSIAA
jgi:hypothetical protein